MMKALSWLQLATALLMVIGGTALRAQDLNFTEFEWTRPENAPDTLPVVRGFDRARVPDELKGLNEPAYARLKLFIDESGKNRTHQIQGSTPWIEEALAHATSYLHYKAATRKGQSAVGDVHCYLIFNPASAKADAPTHSARVLQVHDPKFPSSKKSRHESVIVYVKVTIDPAGRVTNTEAEPAPDPSFTTAATDAVKTWSFAPAKQGGAAVAGTVRVPVLFIPEDAFSTSELSRPPKVIKSAPPEYPLDQHLANLQAEVLVGFVVSSTGQVVQAEVTRSNNPAFNDAALAAVLKWEFEPGIKDGKPVNVSMAVPIIFQIDGGGHEAFTVENHRRDVAKLPPELQVDYPPRVLNAVKAVYPFSLAQSDTEGSAEVQFLVLPNGHVYSPTVTASTHPEFAQSILAMIDQFTFQPASKDGKPALGVLKLKIEFSNFHGDASVTGSAQSILHELKRKEPKIVPLGKVDSKPQPISQHAPVFPSSLKGKVDHGEALIEFYIDKEGYAQLPHSISASDEAFGYSAAQAVAAWRFKPLAQNGKPVIVRAQIPFKFSVIDETKETSGTSAEKK